MAKNVLILIACLIYSLFTPVNAQLSLFEKGGQQHNFLPADQAFAFDFQQNQQQLTLTWHIAPGYYLYQQQIKLTPQQASIGQINFPPAISHQDEFYGHVNIYKQHLALTVPIQQADAASHLQVVYQGCAEAGFCYPPETQTIPLTAVIPSKINASSIANVTPVPNTSAPISATTSEHSAIPFSPLWALLFGIGVAFTPCVLPMYPIITSLILGRGKHFSHSRTLALGITYVQGMAVTYTLLGMVVAALGFQFQAALQQPWILLTISILFIILALSMFGLFSLSLPASIQTKLAEWSNMQSGGSWFGVFMMGAIAGLICSPCTTAPLSAILLYIAQSGNLLYGGLTLYLYALGMGIPLIIVVLFGNRLLPRSGPWMQYVKEAFGFIILLLPIILLERIWGEVWAIRMFSLLAVAAVGWAFILSLRSLTNRARITQILLLILMFMVARPLQDWLWQSILPASSQPIHQSNQLPFTQVKSLTELQTAIQQAHKPVMVDFYADWCVACKEFAKYTFSDPSVAQALAGIQLIQIDVTANNQQDIAFYQHLNIKGLPTILFFDANGHEIAHSRINGFINAPKFLQHLQRIKLAS